MYAVSTAYKTAIKATSRDLRNVSVTLNGVTYSGSQVRGMTVRESVSDNSDRRLPGVAASASIEVTITAALSVNVTGMEMIAKSGLVLPDGTIEYVPLGVFVVKNVEHERGTNITTLTGYDRMCKLEGGFVMPNPSQATKVISFYDLLNLLVPLDNTGDIKWASAPTPTQVSSAFYVNRHRDELDGYTKKELLAYIAGACGKFARFTRNGLLEFAWYSNSGASIPGSCIYMGGLVLKSVADVADAVNIYSNDDVATSGYGDYTNDLIGHYYIAGTSPSCSSTASPGRLRHRGLPYIQAGDIVTVSLRNGSTRKMAVSEQTMTFKGGMVCDMESHGCDGAAYSLMTGTQRDIDRLKRIYNVGTEAESSDT